MASPDTWTLHRASGRPAGPILVTGAPRSGTTWLARLLAQSPGTAMPGREPMNPRGSQFALAGTVSSWVRLERPTPAQAQVLRRCYEGRDPRVYSRFGVRQWSAPLPGTRLVVKDPFAMLSIPAVTASTGALPVLVFRHPAAVLGSYRRMGWTADTDEIRALRARDPQLPRGSRRDPRPADDVTAMVDFWTFLHEVALSDLAGQPRAVVVAHDDLVRGGADAARTLLAACGLDWSPRTEAFLRPISGHRPGSDDEHRLHVFHRSAQDVAESWRARVPADDVRRVEAATAEVWHELLDRRLVLPVTTRS